MFKMYAAANLPANIAVLWTGLVNSVNAVLSSNSDTRVTDENRVAPTRRNSVTNEKKLLVSSFTSGVPSPKANDTNVSNPKTRTTSAR